MKLNVPQDYTGAIRDAEGVQYAPVDGVVEIPDEKVHDGFWGFGFTVYQEPVKVAKVKEA